MSRTRHAVVAVSFALVATTLAATASADLRWDEPIERFAPLAPELAVGLRYREGPLPGPLTLCAPVYRSCSPVRPLDSTQHAGGDVHLAGLDFDGTFFGSGPLRLGFESWVGFGDGPGGVIGGPPQAPGVGQSLSTSWLGASFAAMLSLRVRGDAWRASVDVLPGWTMLKTSVDGSFPPLNASWDSVTLGARVGVTFAVSDSVWLGPYAGATTGPDYTEWSGGLRIAYDMLASRRPRPAPKRDPVD